MNGISTNTVNNLEWSKVRAKKFTGRLSHLDKFWKEEDLRCWTDPIWQQVGQGLADSSGTPFLNQIGDTSPATASTHLLNLDSSEPRYFNWKPVGSAALSGACGYPTARPLEHVLPLCNTWGGMNNTNHLVLLVTIAVLALQAPSIPSIVGGLRRGTDEDAVKPVRPCQCQCPCPTPCLPVQWQCYPCSHLCTIGSSQCNTTEPAVPCGGGSCCRWPPGDNVGIMDMECFWRSSGFWRTTCSHRWREQLQTMVGGSAPGVMSRGRMQHLSDVVW